MASPQLRFKEFNSPLIQDKLVNVTAWSSGGTPSKDNEAYWDGDIPLISGASMHTNKLYESDVKITKLGLQKGSKLAPKDSILILVRGSMLFNKIPMGITLGDVAFNQDVKCIQPKENLTSDFLFQWLSAKENVIQNKVTSTGIGAGKLDTPDLQNLVISLPSKEEQTKIASFLSAVDEKISQLTQKHELLSQYKQGMMQKLFSQQIRFKADDGSDFGEWAEKKLGDICLHFQSGKTITSASISENGEYPVYGGNGLRGYTNTYTHDGIYALIGRQGALCGNINLVTGKNCISEHAIAVQTKKDSSTEWLSRWLDFMQLNRFSESSAQAGLAVNKLVKFDISVPCLEEQTKIANFLSSLDQKIEVVAQQIEQAKQWKKGLLQQMFV